MSAITWCTPCAAEQVFEVPPCEDGHGADCPELACTVCGHAVFVGLAFDVRADRPPVRVDAAA